MKKTLFVLFYSMMSVMLYGQGFVVSADRVNVLYEGVYNPLTIILGNYDCDKLVVSTDNGELKKSDEKCGYTLSRAKPGFANFLVQKKEGARLTKVGEVKYIVKPLSLHSVSLGGRRDGPMPAQIFKVQIGIADTYHECSEAGSFPVISFAVDVLRDERLVFSRENRSNVFDTEVKQFFNEKIKPGDKVYFKNIKCELYGRNRLLESFYVEIKP